MSVGIKTTVRVCVYKFDVENGKKKLINNSLDSIKAMPIQYACGCTVKYIA